MDSTLALGALRIARGAGGEVGGEVGGEAVREREPRRAGEGRLVWNRNSCVLTIACGRQKVKGGHGSNIASSQCIKQCINHHPEPRSGLCPELLADFRIPKPLGARRGAEGSFLCSLITDFLAEGAGWGASPGRGGELGCQAQQVLKKFVRLASGFSSPPTPGVLHC